MRYVLIILLLIPNAAFCQAFSPANPAASGYVLTFDDEFSSISTIDINNTKAPGFNWYVQYPFGSYASAAGDFSVTSGVLTITPSLMEPNNWGISTVVVNSASPTGYYGTAFGGGFYVEARIAFDNTLVNITNGWPSFWGESLQHVMHNPTGGRSDQWPGQVAGYMHFIENDFFEYDIGSGNQWGGAMHDWYGTSLTSVTHNGIVTNGATTWTNFHTVGQLYIPGTASNGFNGSTAQYFDGVLTSNTLSWIDNPPGTPPPSGTFTYSIIDGNGITPQSVVIVLGTGTSSPLQIDYVRVWQIPDCDGLANPGLH